MNEKNKVKTEGFEATFCAVGPASIITEFSIAWHTLTLFFFSARKCSQGWYSSYWYTHLQYAVVTFDHTSPLTLMESYSFAAEENWAMFAVEACILFGFLSGFASAQSGTCCPPDSI